MTLPIIFSVLAIITVLHILYVIHIKEITKQAHFFLIQVGEALLQHPEYVQEGNAAVLDAMNMFHLYRSYDSFISISMATIFLNIMGILSVGQPDVLALHALLAIANGLVLLNSYLFQKRKWQIDAICLGYNISLQSIQYIEVEPKENQKDG